MNTKYWFPCPIRPHKSRSPQISFDPGRRGSVKIPIQRRMKQTDEGNGSVRGKTYWQWLCGNMQQTHRRRCLVPSSLPAHWSQTPVAKQCRSFSPTPPNQRSSYKAEWSGLYVWHSAETHLWIECTRERKMHCLPPQNQTDDLHFD